MTWLVPDNLPSTDLELFYDERIMAFVAAVLFGALLLAQFGGAFVRGMRYIPHYTGLIVLILTAWIGYTLVVMSHHLGDPISTTTPFVAMLRYGCLLAVLVMAIGLVCLIKPFNCIAFKSFFVFRLMCLLSTIAVALFSMYCFPCALHQIFGLSLFKTIGMSAFFYVIITLHVVTIIDITVGPIRLFEEDQPAFVSMAKNSAILRSKPYYFIFMVLCCIIVLAPIGLMLTFLYYDIDAIEDDANAQEDAQNVAIVLFSLGAGYSMIMLWDLIHSTVVGYRFFKYTLTKKGDMVKKRQSSGIFRPAIVGNTELDWDTATPGQVETSFAQAIEEDETRFSMDDDEIPLPPPSDAVTNSTTVPPTESSYVPVNRYEVNAPPYPTQIDQNDASSDINIPPPPPMPTAGTHENLDLQNGPTPATSRQLQFNLQNENVQQRRMTNEINGQQDNKGSELPPLPSMADTLIALRKAREKAELRKSLQDSRMSEPPISTQPVSSITEELRERRASLPQQSSQSLIKPSDMTHTHFHDNDEHEKKDHEQPHMFRQAVVSLAVSKFKQSIADDEDDDDDEEEWESRATTAANSVEDLTAMSEDTHKFRYHILVESAELSSSQDVDNKLDSLPPEFTRLSSNNLAKYLRLPRRAVSIDMTSSLGGKPGYDIVVVCDAPVEHKPDVNRIIEFIRDEMFVQIHSEITISEM